MSLKDEKYVCALAECGTVREAAEKLYISPPALSMYIRNLEKELGVDLFYRSHQRFSPTDIGEIYIARCRKILEIDQEFTAQLGAVKQKKKTGLSIGMYKRCAAYQWLPLQEALHAVFPQLDIRLRVDKPPNLQEMLNDGKLDIILLSTPSAPNIRQTLVGRDELLLACPATWKLHQTPLEKDRFPLVDIQALPREKIFLPGQNQSIYAFVTQFLKSVGMDNAQFPTLNNMEISMQNVAAGIACCFVLRSYLNTFSGLPNIAAYSLCTEPVRVNWYLECLDSTRESRYFPIVRKKIAELLHTARAAALMAVESGGEEK